MEKQQPDLFCKTFLPTETRRDSLSLNSQDFPSQEQLADLGIVTDYLGLDWINVIKPLVAYYGSRFDKDVSALSSIKRGFENGEHFPHITFSVDGQRITIRHDVDSPLTLNRQGDSTYSLNGPTSDSPLYIFKDIAEPESACLINHAYFSESHAGNRDVSITINPVQLCPIRCAFCRREYNYRTEITRGTAGQNRLQYINPVKMAQELTRVFPVDWSSKMQISFVTGSFVNQRVMFNYLASFVNAMFELTNGQFDPKINAHQNIHMASHLVTTEDDYRTLLALGVKTYQNTIEIIDDETRRKTMPKANPKASFIGKDDLTFAQVLDQIRAGIKVMGPDSYFGALVLGLDTFGDTMRGIAELRDTGLLFIDALPFQPFSVDGLSLYKQTSRELITSHLATRSVFRQVRYKFGQE